MGPGRVRGRRRTAHRPVFQSEKNTWPLNGCGPHTNGALAMIPVRVERQEAGYLAALPVQIAQQLARHVDDAQPAVVVPDVQRVVLHPEIVRAGLGDLIPGDLARPLPVGPVDDVDPARRQGRDRIPLAVQLPLAGRRTRRRRTRRACPSRRCGTGTRRGSSRWGTRSGPAPPDGRGCRPGRRRPRRRPPRRRSSSTRRRRRRSPTRRGRCGSAYRARTAPRAAGWRDPRC